MGEPPGLTFRPVGPDDVDAVHRLHHAAFDGEAEPALAVALLGGKAPFISIGALAGEGLVGHVLLSELKGPDRALALAPLAVAPEQQGTGIGSALVERALAAAAAAGWRSVFVLGDPAYYRRFGFSASLADAVMSQWQGPHLMALELDPEALAGYRGPIVYAPPFDDL